MSRAKRHHFVPRAYLERFAESGQVQVRHRDGNSYRANCTNVAVECGFYDVRDTSGYNSDVVEGLLAGGSCGQSATWYRRNRSTPTRGNV